MKVHRIRRIVEVLVVGSAVLLTSPAAAEPADPSRFAERPAEVTRGFVTVAGRQLHYRRAGAQSEHPPLVLFHQSPASSHVYVEFMAEMGADRAVYAPDTPGFGESDMPESPPEIEDYARAFAGFLDAMNLGRVDLVGYHTGAASAIELARRHPHRVRRLILVGIPAFTPEEAAAFEAEPWPQPFDEDGEAVAASWRSTRDWWSRKGGSEAMIRRSFDQKIANGPNAWWGARAALRYRTIDALREVKAPILFIRPQDDLWESSLRVLPAIPDAERLDLPQHGFGMWERAPEEMAEHIRAFLNDPAR